MFSRLKAWLRAIITKLVVDEVSKVAGSLKKERTDTIAALKNLESAFAAKKAEIDASFNQLKTAEFEALEARIKETLENEHTTFLAKLRNTFHDATKGEPSHWKASVEELADAHALKVKK